MRTTEMMMSYIPTTNCNLF